MTLSRLWKVVCVLAVLVALPVDFLNLFRILHVRGEKPPGEEVFEDFRVTDLPDCAFETTFREEAEPAFYLNLLDWLLGIGLAEESAYARAEFKIWKNLVSGGRGTGGVYRVSLWPSIGEMAKYHRELVDERGLHVIQKKFYFDEHGYHARVTMGRPRTLVSQSQHSGCPVDPDRGKTEYRTTSLPFTCANVEVVVADRIDRITTDGPNRCWVSYEYQIDYKARQVRFSEEYFVWIEGEIHDVGAGWPDL